jgi:hypothetical protein
MPFLVWVYLLDRVTIPDPIMTITNAFLFVSVHTQQESPATNGSYNNFRGPQMAPKEVTTNSVGYNSHRPKFINFREHGKQPTEVVELP